MVLRDYKQGTPVTRGLKGLGLAWLVRAEPLGAEPSHVCSCITCICFLLFCLAFSTFLQGLLLFLSVLELSGIGMLIAVYGKFAHHFW